MNRKPDNATRLRELIQYLLNLKDPSPYWRVQATAWGIILAVLVGAGVLGAILVLSSVYGGGNLSYAAKGSPGPVTFRHYTHMTFMDGKYKECRFCHDRIFATDQYATFALRALRDSPPLKVRIGRDSSTLYLPGTLKEEEVAMVTYEVPRACATCATGNCHDGKESFSKLECLKCHQTK